MTNKSANSITVRQLLSIMESAAEYALIDCRETGEHAAEPHILLSVSLPLSQLELLARTLIPRFGVDVIVCDADGGTLSRRTVQRLEELGYISVSYLEGGVAAWIAEGLETFTGDSALGKAFGEFVEHRYGTPHLSAEELKLRLDRGDDILVLDGRTLGEFAAFSVPGAYACPNAELAYRVHDLVQSPETLVVVNCAGRTRSIIGAQSLINAGLPNKVAALENGTMAWLFNNYKLATAQNRLAPWPTETGRQKARNSAKHLTQRFGIQSITVDTLRQFIAEQETRALYIYDVRTREEFETGHLPGSQWAEGGQLVQGLDKWVAVRHGRIVLIDNDDGVRAAVSASWLNQIGWGKVFILAHTLSEEDLKTGPVAPPLWHTPPAAEMISVTDARALVESREIAVIDLATSLEYRAGHIPGAAFAIRSRLPESIDAIRGNGAILLTSADDLLARFAANDLATLTQRSIRVLAGGNNAWKQTGLPLETGDSHLLHKPDDIWRSPYETDGDRHTAFREYLDWELGLVEQLKRDGTVRFEEFAPLDAEPGRDTPRSAGVTAEGPEL